MEMWGEDNLFLGDWDESCIYFNYIIEWRITNQVYIYIFFFFSGWVCGKSKS